MEIIPVNLLLILSVVIIIIILHIHLLIIKNITKKIKTLKNDDPNKSIEMADKYTHFPIHKKLINPLLCYKLYNLIILKRWSEIELVVDSINFKILRKFKKKTLINNYLVNILYMFTNNQVEIAKHMMSKIDDINCYEFRFVRAINDYYDGKIEKCKISLDALLYAQFDPTFNDYYNYYMGLLSEGEEAKKHFQLVLECKSPTLKQKANEMLSKLLEEGGHIG